MKNTNINKCIHKKTIIYFIVIFSIIVITLLSLSCSNIQSFSQQTQEQSSSDLKEISDTVSEESNQESLKVQSSILDYSNLNPNPPQKIVKLTFIHHSTGEDWLNEEKGRLLLELNKNNYFVTDTNYDWGPLDSDVNDGNPIGYHTDIGHWYNWFLGPNSDNYLSKLYNNSHLTESLSNSINDPGGQNEIIMFKSCFSSGQVIYGNPQDCPLAEGENNPLWGNGVMDDIGGNLYTVSNIKGLYRDLLNCFSKNTNKLFIIITTPPSHEQAVDAQMAENLRAINKWLVCNLLENYQYRNVFVFDYYNVLTSNGGNPNTNDLGKDSGSHHRYKDGKVEYLIGSSNFLAYPTVEDGSLDNHPTPAGHKKATAEFVTLLNIAYNYWKE